MEFHKLDTICLTKTGAVGDIHICAINEYTVYQNEGKINQLDGTVLYIKNSLSNKMETVNIGRWIKVLKATVKFGEEKSILSALFRLPSTYIWVFLIFFQRY